MIARDALIPWIEKYGPLPEEATHVVCYRFEKGQRATIIHRVKGEKSDFWLPALGVWHKSAFPYYHRHLKKIPKKYRGKVLNDTRTKGLLLIG